MADSDGLSLTPLPQSVHRCGYGCITFRGSPEWRYPVARDPNPHAKHAIERDVGIILRLIAEEGPRARQLLTHALPHGECQGAYAGLRDNGEEGARRRCRLDGGMR